MNSKVYKYVAGGGKTTFSVDYLGKNKNGLYLAFTNSVVEAVSRKGYASKTIDSLFTSFIIPKFCCMIPLISNCSKISFVDNNKLQEYLKNVSQIRIDEDGMIYNRGKKIDVNLDVSNKTLHEMVDFPNSKALKYIFGKNSLLINHELRSGLCEYIIKKYPEKIIELLKYRFDYIIIDEAQDLNGYREKFAELLYKSSLKLIILGDDNQNINSGGKWFEKLPVYKNYDISYRCPETNCKWIRENLDIQITGNSNKSTIERISYDYLKQLDNNEYYLLYHSAQGKNKEIVDNWRGQKDTIKSAKGSTIEKNIVIIGKSLSKKNLYTAITRTTKSVLFTSEIVQ